MSHTYRTLAAAKVAVEAIGVDIARGGLPKRFSPFVFAFTGNGNVTRGAMEIFTQLPHRMVKPSELRALAESKGTERTAVGPRQSFRSLESGRAPACRVVLLRLRSGRGVRHTAHGRGLYPAAGRHRAPRESCRLPRAPRKVPVRLP